MFKKLSRVTLLSAAILAGNIGVHGQNFVHSNAPEFVFNDRSTFSGDMSCFAFQNHMTQTAWGDVDVYLSGRGYGFSEITALFTEPGNPSNVYYHGTLSGFQGLYDDGSFHQVGAIYNQNTGTVQILVAYQWAGFKVDIFDVTNSPTDPIVYNNTIDLTSGPAYFNYFNYRIRMDSDGEKLSKVAIVWDNPNVGIQTIVCDGGNWSNILTLDNTTGEKGPDVAFNYMQGEPTVNYVHHNAAGTEITESVIDFNVLMSSAGTVYPNIMDINYLSTPLTSNLVLDAQDVANGKGWAYTYSDFIGVYVRNLYDDPFFGSSLSTITVNDGSLGNASLYGQYENYSPTLAYVPRGTDKGGYMVGWYVSNGTYNGYISMEMAKDGGSLISDQDYLEVPFGTTLNPLYAYPYAPDFPETSIAFSKADGKMAPDNYLYTVYNNFENPSNAELHHAFHRRDLTTFNDKTNKLDFSQVKAYPNPFNHTINTVVTLNKQGSVNLQLLDVAGRVVSHYETIVEKGTYPMQLNGLENIVPGTYFLKTSVDGKQVSVTTMSKK